MRYFGMDVARSLFMVLGVFFHSAQIFRSTGQYRVNYPENHVFFDQFVFFIYDFRMYGFYIIAGFFYALSVDKNTNRYALNSRFYRLGIPLLMVGFSLNPVMNYFSVNRSYSTNVIDYIWSGDWLGHMWFIGNLLVYCIFAFMFLGMLRPLFNMLGKNVVSLITVLMVCSLGSVVLMVVGERIYGETLLFVNFGKLYRYALFFLLGLLFYENKAIFNRFMDVKCSAPLLLVGGCMMLLANSSDLSTRHYYFWLIIQTFYRLSLSLFLLSVFHKISRGSQVLNKLVDSGYTVYLLHLPFIIFLYPAILFLGQSVWISYTLLVTATLCLTFLAHENLVVRFQVAALLLNGVRKRDFLRKYGDRQISIT